MISIIIVTCNSQGYLKACLDSVFSQDAGDWEVIVVDNGSTDGTAAFVKRNYAQVKLLVNSANLGACKARNQAIACSQGDWVLTLDSDCNLQEGFIRGFSSLKDGFSADIGMAAPNILNPEGKTIYSQGIYLSKLRRFYDLNRNKPGCYAASNRKGILGPCSAAAFYRRSMLDRLKEKSGYFDERFFFLVEDVDLAWRANRAGWKVMFLPGISCFHHGDSSGTGKKLRQYLCFRNRHLMIRKNERLSGKLIVYSMGVFYDLGRFIYLALFNRYFWKGLVRVEI
jgi:GT2 family glycosyltransferase